MIPFKEAKTQKNVSQRDIFKATGIQQATLSRGEKGTPFTAKNAAKLAQYFGFPWEERHFLYPERYSDFAPPAEESQQAVA